MSQAEKIEGIRASTLMREYLKWIEGKLDRDRKRLFSILEAWGVPLPVPRVWQREWEG